MNIQEIEQKFNNFKEFMKSIEDISFKYTMLLDQCDMPTFLHGLTTYKGDTIEQMVSKLCQKADININNVSEEQKNKFKRYIEFFQEVITILKI